MKKAIVIIVFIIIVLIIFLVINSGKKEEPIESKELKKQKIDIEKVNNIFIPNDQLNPLELQARKDLLKSLEKEPGANKTQAGKIVHDTSATVLKGLVQPFKSFSGKNSESELFNPVMQTEEFEELNKYIDFLDDAGHSVGQWYTNKQSKNAVKFNENTASGDITGLVNMFKANKDKPTEALQK